jgi:hypothetical protein
MLAENDLEIIESGSIGGLVVFIGMLFQNLWLLVTYNLPGLRWLSWTINRGFNAIILQLDGMLGMPHKFPVIIYVLAKQKDHS